MYLVTLARIADDFLGSADAVSIASFRSIDVFTPPSFFFAGKGRIRRHHLNVPALINRRSSTLSNHQLMHKHDLARDFKRRAIYSALPIFSLEEIYRCIDYFIIIIRAIHRVELFEVTHRFVRNCRPVATQNATKNARKWRPKTLTIISILQTRLLSLLMRYEGLDSFGSPCPRCWTWKYWI